MNCAIQTPTAADLSCLMCGQKKFGRNTKDQLAAVMDGRAELSAEKKDRFIEKYDLRRPAAVAYANSLKAASDIPNKRGSL